MKAAVLSSGRGWHTSDLIRALEARGHVASFLPLDRLVARVGGAKSLEIEGADLLELDAVVLRTVPAGSLEQIVFRIDALHRLERMGVQVLNPARVIERTVDKYFTSSLLEEAGLPTPRTVVAQTTAAAMHTFRAAVVNSQRRNAEAPGWTKFPAPSRISRQVDCTTSETDSWARSSDPIRPRT
jgi:glutathione synthase/RimK-type ligase-like ATP-grasp enzyme